MSGRTAECGRRRRAACTGLVILAAGLALAGCSLPYEERLVPGSELVIGVESLPSSLNPSVAGVPAAAHADPADLLFGGFAHRGDGFDWVADPDFGVYGPVDDDPFSVRYEINPAVTWSDGVALDEADLLLAWLAQYSGITASGVGAEADPDEDPTGGETEPETEPEATETDGTETGDVETDDASPVGIDDSGEPLFAHRAPRLDTVPEPPVLGDRSAILVYQDGVGDWRSPLQPTVPAHVVVATAHPELADPAAAKAALIEAVRSDDRAWLAPVAEAWNGWGDLESVSSAGSTLVTSGPYSLEEVRDDGSLELRADPDFRGGEPATTQTVIIRPVGGIEAQLAALEAGEIDVAVGAPVAGAAVPDALVGDRSALIAGPVHHRLVLDLSGDQGAFAELGYPNRSTAAAVREAFLLAFPVEALHAEAMSWSPIAPPVRESLVLAPGAAGYGDTSLAVSTDAAEARQLLVDAGLALPVQVRLVWQGEPSDAQRAILAEVLSEAGFDIGRVRTADSPGDSTAAEALPEFDALVAVIPSSDEAYTQLNESFAAGRSGNVGGIDEPDLTLRLGELADEPDAARARDDLIRIVELLDELSAAQPLYHDPILVSWAADVRGVDPRSAGGGLLRQAVDWASVES